GHSMGARIAMRAANTGCEFSRLALIYPPVSGPGRRPYPSKLPWYVEAGVQQFGAQPQLAFRPCRAKRLHALGINACQREANAIDIPG
ncbi:alpha/beta hydrolase, partial [Rhizobium ruizarguesonis]